MKAFLPSALSIVALGACSAGNQASSESGSGGAAATSGTMATTGTGGAATTGSAAQGSGGGISITVGSGGGGGGSAIVAYAHTNTKLYTFDPTTPMVAPTLVGTFDCIGGSGQDSSMTDIAVNDQGDLWAISDTTFYHLAVQGTTVHCASSTHINSPQHVYFYGLSFAPKGVLDMTKEVLVAGNTAGELWAIDSLGNLSQHGTFGTVPVNDGHGHNYPNANVGKAWELSGDIAFVDNGNNPVGFATVRDCPNPPSTSGCSAVDTLIEINVGALGTATTGSVTQSVRGQVVKKSGCPDAGNANGYGSMYGIAAIGSNVYGFSHSGAIVDIDNTDGQACLVQSTPSLLWDGAGVTTLAPVIVPVN